MIAVLDFLGQMVGKAPMTTVRDEDEMAQEKFHERALIKMGYLEEHLVTVSNQPAGTVMMAACTAAAAAGFVGREYTRFGLVGTNTIRLVTLTNDAAARLSRWEQLIRKADVPPGGK